MVNTLTDKPGYGRGLGLLSLDVRAMGIAYPQKKGKKLRISEEVSADGI